MEAWQLKLRDDLWQLFFQYCEQQQIDAELRIAPTGIGELFSLADANPIACWRTWLEGYWTLKSLISGEDEWVAGVLRETFQREYPDAYEHFLQTEYRIDKDRATDFSFCYRDGEIAQVAINGWRQE